jgi:hypothetical protein
MTDVLDAYDLPVSELPEFYRKLNAPVTYPDGMVTSLGIVYWGRQEHAAAVERAVPVLQAAGIQRFRELLEAIRTPGRMKQFGEQTGLSAGLLRVLKHDLELWLPRPVPLPAIELIQKYAAYWGLLAKMGITDQLALISACQTPKLRGVLARRLDLPLEALKEMTRCCDMYRMGDNLTHIRARIYYQMGLDTWQKWAAATSEEVIQRFTDYIQRHGLESVRLVPWPKEVRNGIEWAKMHLSVFAVEW